jgi:hypothetical protein
MEDPADPDIRQTEPPPVPSRPPSTTPIVWLTLAALVVLGTTAFFFFQRNQQPVPGAAREESPPAAVAPAERPPLGVDVEPIDVPPLDRSDALVRELVAQLSSHPRVAAWLATDGLIRNFVVVVENIAAGRSPANLVRVLRPAGQFRVIERGEEVVIDPASYERYTPLADAVRSVDVEGAARLYTTLKPRLEEAYRELGHQDSFDRAFERAIAALLATPVLEGGLPVTSKGALYVYEEPRLERLTAAQRQFARMGPVNVRTVQARLRELAIELGIPARTLPPRQ